MKITPMMIQALAATLAVVAMLPADARGAEPARVVTETVTPMQDPWVPPALRNSKEAPAATQGAALQAQVEKKLKDQFMAAASSTAGTLTREQAQAAGLGYLVNHFDKIDRQKTGVIRYDDVSVFLQERRGSTQ